MCLERLRGVQRRVDGHPSSRRQPARDRCGLTGGCMSGDGRQGQQIVDLLSGWRIDACGGGESSAPLGDLVRHVAHGFSLPCAAVSLTNDELIDRGMATAIYAGDAPGRMAVISPYGDRTFHELNAHANQLVRALRALG